MEVETLSKTTVDEVEYTLEACDARYAGDENLGKRAHYTVRATRRDQQARAIPDGGLCYGSIIATVSFPFTAEGGRLARATYSALCTVAEIPLMRRIEAEVERREEKTSSTVDIFDSKGTKITSLFVQETFNNGDVWATSTAKSASRGYTLRTDGSVHSERYGKDGDLLESKHISGHRWEYASR